MGVTNQPGARLLLRGKHWRHYLSPLFLRQGHTYKGVTVPGFFIAALIDSRRFCNFDRSRTPGLQRCQPRSVRKLVVQNLSHRSPHVMPSDRANRNRGFRPLHDDVRNLPKPHQVYLKMERSPVRRTCAHHPTLSL
jgi:hypothetical protein